MSDNNPAKTVFISYAREDFKHAERLYNELKKAGFKSWLDKHNILPGQDWKEEIMDAIENSRYFIPLFSSTSVQKIGFVQTEYTFALDYADRYPPRMIFAIPVRLDDCKIPYRKLRQKHTVDLFPEQKWNEGVTSIIQALNLENNDKDDGKTGKDIDNNLITSIANTTSSSLSSLLVQKTSRLFKGEKLFFVGREEYINKIIKEQIKIPSIKVCIVGPGGSGKSQLAFKAIHQYEKEGLFDLVVPVYFSDASKMTFSSFLLNIVKTLFDINDINEFEKLNIDDQKTIVYNFLAQKKHPLLFLDNYETVSYIINDERQTATEQYDEAVNISNYLNLLNNTSILITSRERNNNFEDKEIPIDLEGLHEQETRKLFSKLTKERYLKNVKNIMTDPKSKAALSKIFKMTGGHPLSIEIIAKNISSIHQINQMADTLGLGIVNTNEPEKRFRSLEACFDYTISRLPEEIKKLLYNLTLFKSPFPIDVAQEIFNKNIKSVDELKERSLLFEIKSESSSDEISNSEYWLYDIHPAIRNYLEKTMQKAINKIYPDLEKEYGQKFYKYYCNILFNTCNSIGKENIHKFSIARFNLIFNHGSENNDFDRVITFAEHYNDLIYSASICREMGLILNSIGILSKALSYHKKSLDSNQKRNDRLGMAGDYSNIGIIFKNMGNQDEAMNSSRQALEIHEDLNDMSSMARDYDNIGLAYFYKGQLDDALEFHNKALEIDKDLNDRLGIARDYGNIGLAHYYKGQLDDALEFHNKALEIDKDLNDRLGIARDYGNIGLAHYDKGQLDDALKYHEKALEIHAELNDRLGMAKNYTSAGMVYRDKGQLDDALKYHEKALEIHAELNDKVDMARDYNNIGLDFFYKGQLDDALEFHNKALEIRTELKEKIRMAKTYTDIGMVYRDKGQLDDALKYHEKALEIDRVLNDKVNMARDYGNIGLTFKYKGQLDDALEFLTKALEIHIDLNDKVETARDYSNIGLVYFYKGKMENALEFHNKSLEIRRVLNDKVNMARDYSNIGLVYFYKGQLNNALEYHEKALSIRTKLNDKIGISKVYYNISRIFFTENTLNSKNDKDKSLHYLKKSKEVLEVFEKETKYRYPFMETVLKRFNELENNT